MATLGDSSSRMTVGELRAILEADWIDDNLVLYDYEDNFIRDVNLVIDRNGDVTEARIGMVKD